VNKLKKITTERPPVLESEFSSLPFSQHGLSKLVNDFDFETVLDVGSGAGAHAKVLKNHGKKVTALDFGTSIYALQMNDNYDGIHHVEIDFNKYNPEQKFDCIWASHVLEHQENPGVFIKKCMDLVEDNGILAITVPPLDDNITGGHLTLWNAGLLLYQLVFNGLDCRDASIYSYGYNITVIVRKKVRSQQILAYDNGDITKLKAYFPSFIDTEPFDGRIVRWNW